MRWKETKARELEDVRRFEVFRETTDLKSDWSWCHQPPMEFELSSSYDKLEGESDAYCNIWTDAEPARVKTCEVHSFAMEARIRLDHLKSRCNSPTPGSVSSRSLYSYNCETDLWDSEESALDSVQILDIEEDELDEESWLYELPNKLVNKEESALTWCRYFLDNPSPEMEAARHALMNKLDQRSRYELYRQPAAFHHAASVSAGTTSTRSTLSYSFDHNELSNTQDSITTSYRLQDMTDVHIMAQIQEASLRQDYISMPSTASSMRSPESSATLSSSSDAVGENKDYFTVPSKTRAGSKSLSSSPCQSPQLAAKQSCQSPRLARLHQQVAQFKLLKRAQNRGGSPARTSSPRGTSLRSLQAVRNSRSLESDDDGSPAEQFTPPPPPPGGSPSRTEWSGWSTMMSPTSLSSRTSALLKKEASLRTAAIKSLQRSQSLSPCRIPHPAKGLLSVTGRVFASPERATAGAWSRNAPLIHR